MGSRGGMSIRQRRQHEDHAKSDGVGGIVTARRMCDESDGRPAGKRGSRFD
jgi:hypothetical protein